MLRVRLACVKHAASVRSEPGSNSHLKLVFRPWGFTSPRSERTVKHRSIFFKLPKRFRALKPEISNSAQFGTPESNAINQTGSGLFHSIVKEQVLPGQLEGTTDNPQVYALTKKSQAYNESQLKMAVSNSGSFRQ